ncbi:hypothetical protein NPIL_487801 [Nephila pilipes]|uniref:Uncharacterized protein n=1 Tax=Nephila pilipes TaxID=299642 RepID=A0A8X6NCA5_NEPPI|nr:hypothetical protein NPIL_487801 [Nephila pilipes]
MNQTLAWVGISRRYTVLTRKLICSGTIRWGRDIYIEHISDLMLVTSLKPSLRAPPLLLSDAFDREATTSSFRPHQF